MLISSQPMGLRHLFSPLAALTLLCGAAHADCDGDLSFNESSRSDWAKTFQISHPTDDFLSIRSAKKPVVSKIEQDSFASGDDQFLKVISDLESWMVHPEDLPETYSPAETILYFEERLDLIRKGIEELDLRLKLTAPEFEIKFSENWATWYKKMESATRNLKGKTDSEQIAAQAKELFNLEMGVLTEIRSVLSFEGVKDLSTSISKNGELSDDLQMAIWDLQEATLKNPQAMLDAIANHPAIFKAPVYTNHQKKEKFPNLKADELNTPIAVPAAEYLSYFSSPIQVEYYLTKVQKWILTKEIDLVRQRKDGTICWIEVKRNREKEDFTRFKLKINGRKSHLEQIIEDLNIIKFMGNEGKIKLQYYSSSGVTDEVRLFLLGLGVEVL